MHRSSPLKLASLPSLACRGQSRGLSVCFLGMNSTHSGLFFVALYLNSASKYVAAAKQLASPQKRIYQQTIGPKSYRFGRGSLPVLWHLHAVFPDDASGLSSLIDAIWSSYQFLKKSVPRMLYTQNPKTLNLLPNPERHVGSPLEGQLLNPLPCPKHPSCHPEKRSAMYLRDYTWKVGNVKVCGDV